MYARLSSFPALALYWVLLSLTAMVPYVFLDRLIAPGADAIAYYYPAMYWYSEALISGDSFLWDPQIFSGFPSYLSQVSGYIEPVNFTFFSILPWLLAYHVRLVLDYVLVMLFSFLAARKWGISKLAAFFIGPMYLLAFHWWYLSNTVIANSLFLLPYLLWVYMESRDASRVWKKVGWGLLGGIGVGWAFLGGYAQFVVYALTFVGLFAVSDFFALTERVRQTWREVFERSGILALFALLGLMIGLPMILASLAYIPFTVRDGGLSYAVTQVKVLEPQELVFVFLPDYLRLPFVNGGKKTLYIGTLFLMAALVAIIHLRRSRLIAIVFGLFMFAFILALPGSPLYWLLHQLPIFELFRYPYRWMYLGIWMLAVLGAIGFDTLKDGHFDKWTRAIAVAFSVMASGLVVLVLFSTFAGNLFWQPVKDLFFWLFSTFVYAGGGFGKALPHYHDAIARGIDAWRSVASLTNMPFTVPLASFVFAVVLFVGRVYEAIRWREFQILSAGLLTVTFIGIFIARWPDSLPADVLHAHVQSAKGVIPESDRDMYRVQPFNLGETFSKRVPASLAWNSEDVLAGVELQFASLAPNNNHFAGFSLTDGYDPFVARDVRDVLAHLGTNYAAEDSVNGIPIEERKRRLTENLDVLGMMAGKYVISGTEIEHPQLTLIATPAASRYDIPYYIYKNTTAQPRVRLATKTESIHHSSTMELISKGKKFHSVTYLDCENCAREGSDESVVIINKLGNGFFDITVDAQRAEWVLIAEQYLPGWRAKIDENDVRPVRANGMYMAYLIPEGEHNLVVQYEGIRGEARWLRMLGLYPYPSIEK